VVDRQTRVLGVAAGVGAVALGTVWLAGFWAYVTHDRVDFIDTDRVFSAAEVACGHMSERLDGVSVTGDPVTRIEAENKVVLEMVNGIRRVGVAALEADMPAADWLADWEQLVDARHQVTTGSAFVVPTTEGVPITERMNWVAQDSGLKACRVPARLLDPPQIGS
jgi:hypothetical protein